MRIFFEDIKEGAEIPTFVKRINLLEMVRYSAATWNFYLLHIEKEYAQKKGFKDANIPAPFFGALMATMLTRWTGYSLCLRRLSYEVKVMGFPGDEFFFKGRVTKKYEEAGDHLAECDLWVENQNGVKVAAGSSKVLLPCRIE
jgi:acyl dehydratase